MFLFELEADPLAIKIVGIVNQLKAEVEMGQRSDMMSEQDLINALRSQEVYINSKQLGDMLNSQPLKNMLKIKNHKVTFTGNEDTASELPDIDPEKKAKDDKKIVGSMAKKALKTPNEPKIPDVSSQLENPPLKPPPLPK